MEPRGRIRLWDAIRGFSVASMVLFHLCYDLTALAGRDLPWFQPPFEDIWRASISWTFLAVAGVMCSFSHDNLTRSLRYLAVALAIWVVTSLVAVDTPISFGIIFCIGGATLIDALLEKLHWEPRGWVWAAVLFCLFVICLPIPRGAIGLPGCAVALPRGLYTCGYLDFLGFPSPRFASGDYYPLLPFALMYGAGIAMGRALKSRGYPRWFLKAHCAPLEFLGRHALIIYVVHQPLLLGLCGLL